MWQKLCLILLLITGVVNVANGAAFNQRADVKAYIHDLVTRYHFDQQYVDGLFAKVHLLKRAKHHMSHPFEANPWGLYQRHFLTKRRVEGGVQYWRDHQAVLRVVEQQYHVPAAIIVAIIGVESNYGKRTGGFPALDTLATMAFDYPYRHHFFRNELTQFLLMTREQQFDPWQVYGSYAGALGQPQFMPSSYRHYAVDYSGGHHADLMHNDNDVIASVANYFMQKGWQARGRICQPTSQSKADLVLHGQQGDEYWQTFHNFSVIKRYNTSDLYALAVYQLSRKIADHYYHNANRKHSV